MDSSELRKIFLDYFQEKGHKVVPSSSLIPQDNTVLFTTAGMQQFSDFLSGKKDPVNIFGTRHLCSVQKCFRTGDIEEIGDDTHYTFFEMLGNWSIGQDEKGYFKEGSIEYALDFLVNKMGLDKDRFHITVFKGEGGIAKDEESVEIWKKHGIPKERIHAFDKKDNFWGPVGETGPCGPCSEIHYDRGKEYGCEECCGPNCEKCKRVVEIWNLVFMEYFKNEKGGYEKLSQTNVDTGIGFERLLSILNNNNSAYETDLFSDLIKRIEENSSFKYSDKEKEFRIIADHIRGSVFLISEGIVPSNTDRGYVLRRLIRRIVRYAKIIELDNFDILVNTVIEKYKDVYPEIEKNNVMEVFLQERAKFEKTIEKGLDEISKLSEITARDAFNVYQTFGFPIEMIKEEAEKRGIVIDEKGFEEELRKHQDISRAGIRKKFGGVGKDVGEKEARLHTATHLLHSALRMVLGNDVRQMGSDINNERLRFDFNYGDKTTEEQIKEVEKIVNEKIQAGLGVVKEEMKLEDALNSGVLAFFKERYPDKVNVYSIIDNKTGEVFSKEICAGPHADNTKELGGIKIIKEESSGAGIRRIKATLI